MTKEVKIMIAIAAVVLVGGGLLFWSSNVTPATPGTAVDAKSLVRDTSHMTGNKDAKVTLVEFGDYECPYCAQEEPIVERIREEYKSNTNFNFVFRHFPLSQHATAKPAAEAAEAAGEQGKFWEMHHKLYAEQKSWVENDNHAALFEGYARELGLDVGKFNQSWKGNKFADVIDADTKDGNAAGVAGTPTFFLNGEKLTTYSYEDLKKAIDEKLK